MNLEGELIVRLDDISQRKIGTIEAHLRGMRELFLKYVRPEYYQEENLDPQIYNPDLSCLSEMPLCSPLRELDKIWIPDGFSLIWGHITFPDRDGSSTKPHYYLTHPAGLIVCLTPGQFENYGQIPDIKGAKLDELPKKAPTLINRVSTEVAVLRGSRRDIQNQLGFEYLDVKPILTF